jgi:hypothetical protein
MQLVVISYSLIGIEKVVIQINVSITLQSHWKTVQVYFHAAGYDILPPSRYVDKAIVFLFINVSSLTY